MSLAYPYANISQYAAQYGYDTDRKTSEGLYLKDGKNPELTKLVGGTGTSNQLTPESTKYVNQYIRDNQDKGYTLAPGDDGDYYQVNTLNTQRYKTTDGRGSWGTESYALPIYAKLPAQTASAAPAAQQMANPASAQEAVDRANQYKAEADRIQGELKNQPVPELNYTPGNWDATAGSYTPGNGIGAVAKLAADIGRQGQAYTGLMHDRAKNSQDIASNFLEQFAYTLPKVPEEKSQDDMIAQAKKYASIFKA